MKVYVFVCLFICLSAWSIYVHNQSKNDECIFIKYVYMGKAPPKEICDYNLGKTGIFNCPIVNDIWFVVKMPKIWYLGKFSSW